MDCLRAFGDPTFCDCIREKAPAIASFVDYVKVVTTSKEDLGYAKLDADWKGFVDNLLRAREVCVTASQAGRQRLAAPPCMVLTYDHVRLLGGIDEARRRSEAVRAELLRETPRGPATELKLAFVESRLSHLGDLAAFLETYFRAGYVDSRLCYGDGFLDSEVYYPSFQLINATETLDLLRSLESKSEPASPPGAVPPGLPFPARRSACATY